MQPFTFEKKNCTGCGACYNACPVQCISMLRDEEGFLYPQASNACVNCGLCEKICPSVNPQESLCSQQEAFAALSNNYKVWKRSASGGAFSEICRAWGDNDTMFTGAVWDGFQVKHTSVIGYEYIAPLCKSKYVASDTGKVFTDIKRHLKLGKKAVFCGTPCQVAGLRAYLQMDYDNLLLIDLICHGAGSPFVFGECIKKMERQYSRKIKSYEFRTKGHQYDKDYIQKITFDGQNEELIVTTDPYIQCFLKQNCLRPSCGENCIYRTQGRQGDITIADFKGLTEVFSELTGCKKNYSSIVFNSIKGHTVKDNLTDSMNLLECSLDDIKKYNPLFYRQTWFSETRDQFFKDFCAAPEVSLEKWTTPAETYKKSIKQKCMDLLPIGARKILLTYKKRRASK